MAENMSFTRCTMHEFPFKKHTHYQRMRKTKTINIDGDWRNLKSIEKEEEIKSRLHPHRRNEKQLLRRNFYPHLQETNASFYGGGYQSKNDCKNARLRILYFYRFKKYVSNEPLEEIFLLPPWKKLPYSSNTHPLSSLIRACAPGTESFVMTLRRRTKIIWIVE